MVDGEWMRLGLMAYEAGFDPALWPAFLEAYARACRADISLIQVHRFAEHRSEVIVSYGLQNRFRAEYNDYYSKVNVWRENGESKYKYHQVIVDAEVYPRSLLERSEFYNDFLQPMCAVHTMGGVVNRQKSAAVSLTVLRDRQKGGWDASDKLWVKALLPHVTRACSIQQKLWIFRAAETVLDGLPMGIVLFDRDERVVYFNRTAQAIFAQGDGLSLKAGVLASSDAMASAAMQQAIRNAARMELSSLGTEMLLVERRSCLRSYQIIVLPMRRQFRQLAGMGAPAVLVIIADPELQNTPSADIVRKLYGLTPKEAELAEKLASGLSPADAAAEMNMQYETARTHLKRVFSKMGISRQNELAALVARIPKIQED